jgi:hypothetical protein
MRPWISSLAVVLVAGVAVVVRAQSNEADPPKKYHSVDAEVVSVNSKDMTITVKVDGAQHTERVSALARTRLSSVKAGEKVVLSCRDVDGKHREVVSIRPGKAAAAK